MPFIANLLYLYGKKGGKINGTLFLVSQNLNKCTILFEIFPSSFLCVKPIGGTKGLCNLKPVSAMLSTVGRKEQNILTKFDVPDTFSKSEITCSHFG